MGEPLPQSSDLTTDVRASRLGLVVGLVISVVLGAALVIPAAQAGITPGVSPLVVLFGWVAFGAALGPRLRRFLAMAQVTGSGGAAVTAGVVFTAPMLQLLFAEQGMPVPPVDVPLLMMASVSGALLGFGFVGLATKRFLSDPRLPAPEAVACDRLIRTAVERPDERPQLLPSLIAGLAGAIGVKLLTHFVWLREEVWQLGFRIWSSATGGVDSATAATPDGAATEAPPPEVTIPFPISPLYLGIGGLLTLPTAILIFSGGLVNALTRGYSATHAMPGTTFRWVGGAAMTVAVLYSLANYVLEGRRKSKAALATAATTTAYDEALLELSPGARRLCHLSIVGGAVLLIGMMAWIGGSVTALVVMAIVALILLSLLSGLGGLLSLQVGASASPVSGTVFMGLLVLSLTALGVGFRGIEGVVFLVPLVVASCVAICAANDSSQDYKTIQLNGFRVSDSFFGHLLGLLGGAIAVPLTLGLADKIYGLGSGTLQMPQAAFFSTVLQSLFLKSEIPWGPVGFGAGLGVVAVIIQIVGQKRGVILSSLAFAVGIYLSVATGIGIMLGALARFLATRKVSASTHQGILAAAGLIAGYAFAELVLGMLIMAEVVPPGVERDSPLLPAFVGVLGLLALMGLILGNYAKGRQEEGGGH